MTKARSRIGERLMVAAYLGGAILLYVRLVGPALRSEISERLWADSETYRVLATTDIELITFAANFQPILVYRALNHDDGAVVACNIGLFLISWLSLRSLPMAYPSRMTPLLLLNPMLLFSLTTLNKEILGLTAVSLLTRAVFTQQRFLAYAAAAVSLLARWQLFVVFLIYFILTSTRLARTNKLKVFLMVIVAVSVLYPLVLGPMVAAELPMDVELSSQQTRFGAVLTQLNWLQNHGLYALAVLPKTALNLVGNVARVFRVFSPSDVDFYNRYVVLGHQVAMLAVLLLSASRWTRLAATPVILFLGLYVVFFSLSPFIQYRYFFPLYGLFCAVAAGLFPLKEPAQPRHDAFRQRGNGPRSKRLKISLPRARRHLSIWKGGLWRRGVVVFPP